MGAPSELVRLLVGALGNACTGGQAGQWHPIKSLRPANGWGLRSAATPATPSLLLLEHLVLRVAAGFEVGGEVENLLLGQRVEQVLRHHRRL